MFCRFLSSWFTGFFFVVVGGRGVVGKITAVRCVIGGVARCVIGGVARTIARHIQHQPGLQIILVLTAVCVLFLLHLANGFERLFQLFGGHFIDGTGGEIEDGHHFLIKTPVFLKHALVVDGPLEEFCWRVHVEIGVQQVFLACDGGGRHGCVVDGSTLDAF